MIAHVAVQPEVVLVAGPPDARVTMMMRLTVRGAILRIQVDIALEPVHRSGVVCDEWGRGVSGGSGG